MRRARTPKPPPLLRDRAAFLALADGALASPPTKPWIRRPVPAGTRVARFVLPLELLQPTNRTGRLAQAQPWARQRAKERVWLAMRAQCLPWEEPLPGRPQVLCVRFTSVPTDAYSDWAKLAVDVLCARKEGSLRRLGIIVDDRPSAADVVQWCEPAPGGKRFCLIEVRDGS